MKITQCELDRFNHFRFSQIQSLKVHFDAPLQLILGSNGSGKSRMLSQLAPKSPTRSDYEEYEPGTKKAIAAGVRILTIEHDQSIYQLISDFNNRTSPHHFKKDDEELNDGGTTNVQEELIQQHFGITPIIDAIVHSRMKLCNMPARERRAFLMDANPANTGFILEKQKKIQSKIKACKNVLTELTERKTLLESKFLNEQDLQLQHDASVQLTEDVAWTIQIGGVIKGLLSQYPDFSMLEKVEQQVPDYLDSIQKLPRNHVRWVKFWSSQTKLHDPERVRLRLEQALGKLDGQKEGILLAMTDLATTLNEHENRISELMQQGTVPEIKLRLTKLYHERAELQKKAVIDTILSKEELAEASAHLDRVHVILTQFTNASEKILSIRKYRLKQMHHLGWSRQYAGWSRELDTLHARQDQLNSAMKIRLQDIPDQPCAKFQCPLFASFKRQHDTIQHELTDVTNRIQRSERVVQRVQLYLDQQQAQFDRQQSYQALLTELQDIVRSVMLFRLVFKHTDIATRLYLNPLGYYHQIVDLHERATAYHQLKELEHQILQDEVVLHNSQDITVEETQRVKTILEAARTRYAQFDHRRIKIDQKIGQINHQKHAVVSYEAAMRQLRNRVEDGKRLEKLAMQYAEVTHLRSLLTYIEAAQMHAIQELGRINARLKEQEHLKVRYQEEVLNRLEGLDQQKQQLEWIERALHDIPHRYTVQFINAVIDVMNQLIEMVFTYEFKLVELDEDADVTYQFAVMVGDTLVPDISECSEAQQEIVNLVFCLSLRIVLKIVDYPIYLDEVGKSFDTMHKTKLLDLLRYVLDEEIVSQMFLVNHHATVHEGMTNGQTLVLNDTNILVPSTFNTHAEFVMN